MKIAIFGRGKMGALLQKIHPIEDIVDIENADVCIDFSHPESVVQTIARAVMHRVPIVVGTTGWYDSLPYVQDLVDEGEGALLYGANFSVGMHLFSRLIRHANILLQEYEVAGLEIHHRGKQDAPSGTALELTKVLSERRKNVPRFESVRVGDMLGVHSIFFDGDNETIECSHRAKNRNGYAKGAIEAAEWLIGKTGVYTFEDYMEERLTWTFREQSLRS